MDVIGQIWHQATTAFPPPARTVLIATAWAAGMVVLTPLWRVARHAITIAHEGAHAIAALLSGRRLSGIRLHSDTSGLTLSAGKPHGIGMFATAFAGYLGPSMIGLGTAALASHGYFAGLLWLLIALLTVMLFTIRNWFGLWSVLVCTATLVGVTWWGSEGLVTLVASLVTWFFLLGAIRPVIELHISRARGRAPHSDADVLARLTRIPAPLWVATLLVLTVSAAVLGAMWMGGTGSAATVAWTSLRQFPVESFCAAS